MIPWQPSRSWRALHIPLDCLLFIVVPLALIGVQGAIVGLIALLILFGQVGTNLRG